MEVIGQGREVRILSAAASQQAGHHVLNPKRHFAQLLAGCGEPKQNEPETKRKSMSLGVEWGRDGRVR